MTQTRHEEEVDIYTLPEAIQHQRGSEITIGDLHGNAMKLLFVLVKHGILKGLSEVDYNRLVEIYEKKVDDLGQSDLKDFNTILSNKDLKFSQDLTLRLLGDELADRGSNDYFTLKILERLGNAKVPLEILVSNHSLEFLLGYYDTNHQFESKLAEGQAASMVNLKSLVDKGWVTTEEISTIVTQEYLPKLKALSYSKILDSKGVVNGISIHSHAVIGLETIESLAQKLSILDLKNGTPKQVIQYDVSNPNALASTIDQINAKLLLWTRSEIFKGLCTAEEISVSAFRNNPKNNVGINEINPFAFVTWNRSVDGIQRPLQQGNPPYQLSFVHGHDYQDQGENVINLDNELGKFHDANQGTYSYCQVAPSIVKLLVDTFKSASKTDDNGSIEPLLTEFIDLYTACEQVGVPISDARIKYENDLLGLMQKSLVIEIESVKQTMSAMLILFKQTLLNSVTQSLSKLEKSIDSNDTIASNYYNELRDRFERIKNNGTAKLDLKNLDEILKDAKIGCQIVKISQSFIAGCKSEMEKSWVKKHGLEKKLDKIKQALYNISLLDRDPKKLLEGPVSQDSELYKVLSANRSWVYQRAPDKIIAKYKTILAKMAETDPENTSTTKIQNQ